MSKRCPKCGKSEPAIVFTKNASRKDGKSSYCVECQRAYTRDHYRGNVGYYVVKAKQHKAEYIKELTRIIDHAKDKPCVDCGRRFPSCAMDLDHVRGKKIMAVALMRVHCWSLDKVLAEISKCEVRCAVCHRIRTHSQRQDSLVG
jgi:hypothetical protein